METLALAAATGAKKTPVAVGSAQFWRGAHINSISRVAVRFPP